MSPLSRIRFPGISSRHPPPWCAAALPLQVVPAGADGQAVRRTPRRKADKAREVGTDPVKAPIALVLIDDNRLLREGIAAMVHTQPGLKVLAAFADVEEALQKVRQAKPDVVLLDFGLEDHDSLSLPATVPECGSTDVR